MPLPQLAPFICGAQRPLPSHVWQVGQPWVLFVQQAELAMQDEPQRLKPERHSEIEQALFKQAALPVHCPSPQQPSRGMQAPSQLFQPERHVVREQTLATQAKLPAQSLSWQQPSFGMQLVPQSLKPLLQVLGEQLLFTQAKLPLQLRSSQQPFIAMQLPPQGFWSAPQLYSQVCRELSHLPTFPAIMGQSASRQQDAEGMHWPLHSLVPAAQSCLHRKVAGSQLGVLPAWAEQSTSVQHSPQRFPQRLPVSQVKSHFLSVQVATPPGGAAGQGVHEVPQLVTLESSTQTPPQSWVPALHGSEHASLAGTHRSRHGFCPSGHLMAQARSTQAAVPPATT